MDQLFSKESRKANRFSSCWTDEELRRLESAHSEGMSAQQIIACFAARGEKLSEACFRKYVQLGLLPRSVRVGRQGQGRGSQGLYPSITVRQLDRIRRLMTQGFSIEDMQKFCLFIRGDIEVLSAHLDRVCGSLSEAMQHRLPEQKRENTQDDLLSRALEEVRSMGVQLLGKLQTIEEHMANRVRMFKASV